VSPRAPQVSVIVPVLNGATLIEGCLRALDRQTLPPSKYEVVVVDDGSTDGTAGIARTFAADARASIVVIEQPENKGPAAARNAGLAVAQASIIAFTDADCEPASDWLACALARLEEEPDLAAVEGRTEPKGTVGTLTHQMVNTAGGLWMTCNMIYRRDAIARAGGFDERFRTAFLEDSDLAFTVLEQGDTIAWDESVLVHHLVLPEGRRKFGREARKRFFNPLLYSKHPELYIRHISTVVPGLPPLHVKYMLGVVAVAGFALAGIAGARVWGGVVLAMLPTALYARRVAHAYRARDPLSILQALAHPFVQTYWVLRGAARFKAFSFKI